VSPEISSKNNFFHSNDFADLKFTITGRAYCDEIREEDSAVRVSGWALIGELGEFKSPKRFIFAVNRKVIGFGYVNIERPDVLSAVDDKAPLKCGFTSLLSQRYITGDPINDLTIYAESDSGLLLEVQGPAGMIGVERLSLDSESPSVDTSVAVDSIHGVALILSTKCNLRCSYCNIHSPLYIEHDMDNTTFESILLDLDKLSVKEVHFGVMGEPTIHKNFFEVVRKIHEEKYIMSIATNFASIFKEEEIEALLLFHTIEISLDTIDINLLRKIRTGADVRTILYNIVRLKSRALQKKMPCPKITLSIVLNEDTAIELPLLAAACNVLNITQCQLLDMRPLGFKKDVSKSLSEAKDKDMALRSLNEAIDYFIDNSISLSIDATVQQFINTSKLKKAMTPQINAAKHGFTSKACFAPWTRAYIAPDGHVTPCFGFTSIGKITPKTSLREIINSSRMRRLRYELLTGRLNDGCRNCCRAEDAPPEIVRELLRKYKTGARRAETFGQPVDVILQ
jgi:MoaA/NifB/PqqE/SkfB family radical SAM enzyme